MIYRLTSSKCIDAISQPHNHHIRKQKRQVNKQIKEVSDNSQEGSESCCNINSFWTREFFF